MEQLMPENINLAVNFMVIQQTLKIMGIYDRVCDEHNELEVIFEKSSNFELGTLLREYAAKGNKEFIASYLDTMHNLFGLEADILLGQRQINLGIGIDPKFEDVSYMDMVSLENWLYENNLENAPVYLQYDATKVAEWERIETFVGHSKKVQYYNNDIIDVVSATINNGIGKFKYHKVLGTPKEAIESLKFNPLGINILGCFTSIYASKYHMAEESESGLDVLLDKSFEIVFSPMNLLERALKETSTQKVLQTFMSSTYGHWNEGIYSLRSIIINLLIHGAPKEDYADKFENQLTRSGTESVDISDMKAMDKFYYHDKLGGYLPFPLVLDKSNSELLELMRSLYQSRYNDGIEIREPMYISTIEDELTYWRRKEKVLEASIQKIVKRHYESQDISSMSYAESAALSKYRWITVTYIPALQEAQRQYDENPLDWSVRYIDLLAQQLDKVVCRLSEIETSTGYESALLENQKVAIQNLLKKHIAMKKEAEKHSDKKIKPLILVKEPYYKETVSIQNYNDGKKRKSTQGDRKYTNPYI